MNVTRVSQPPHRQRLQAKLGYLSPVAYAREYYAGLVAA